MNIGKIRSKKEELHITTADLSVLSGVPIGTINKILNGETASPRYATVKALEKALCIDESISEIGQMIQKAMEGSEHTCEEFYTLPQEIKVELINGKFYSLEVPSMEHQMLIGNLYTKLYALNEKHKQNYFVVSAPIAVQFSECQNTIVQPDIIIMNMDVKETKEKSVVGTPSLVIEVLSDESRVKDGKLKLNQYQEAGVNEYWIVDGENKKVYVYKLQEDVFPIQYGAQEKIPLDIWGENVVVDFFEVPKKVMVSKKNVKTKKEQRTKEPVNPEMEREMQEQALANGKRTSLLDKGIVPLSSFGSSGLKF